MSGNNLNYQRDIDNRGAPMAQRSQNGAAFVSVVDPITGMPSIGATTTSAGVDRSVTTSATSSQLMAANTARRGLFIANDTAIDVWINFGAAAVASPGAGNIKIGANGGRYESGAFTPSTAINIIATSGTPAITAREFIAVSASVADAPTIGVATAGRESATLAFTPGASDGGYTVQDYLISAYDSLTNVRFNTFTATASPATLAPIPAGISAYFKVQSRTNNGFSAQSGASNAVNILAPFAVPGAPTNVVATLNGTTVTSTYNPPAINGGSAIDVYRSTLYRVSDNVQVDSVIGTGALAHTNVPAGAALYTKVDAHNVPAGYGAASPSNIVRTAGGSGELRAFTPADSFSTGDQVTYAGGLYTFTANHPPGNWTGSDVTYNGQSGTRVFNALGMSKPFGVVGTWTPGSPATTAVNTPASSRGLKQHMEAAFTRARVALFQREPTPIRGFAMSVASTEVDTLDTMSNAVDPIVGGVAYNVTRANSQYGLLRVTWDSALRSAVQPPASVISPGQNGLTGLSVAISDWAACQSVPVPAGKRPLLVSRFSQTAAVGDSDANIPAAVMIAEYNKYAANNPSARLYYCPSVGNGDHVADPTLSRAAGNVYNPTASGAWKNIGIIVDHATIPTRVFGGFGDSITEGYSWWQNAVWALSTVNAPCYVANFGCSTNRSVQYQALLNTMIRQDIPMTDIIMPTFSPNEVQAMTDALADGFIAELVKVVALCETFNRRLYLWTSYAAKTTRYSNSPTAVAAINKINDWARTEAAKPNPKFILVEIEPGWNNATMNGDNTHPNGTGIIYMQGQIFPVIQTGA